MLRRPWRSASSSGRTVRAIASTSTSNFYFPPCNCRAFSEQVDIGVPYRTDIRKDRRTVRTDCNASFTQNKSYSSGSGTYDASADKVDLKGKGKEVTLNLLDREQNVDTNVTTCVPASSHCNEAALSLPNSERNGTSTLATSTSSATQIRDGRLKERSKLLGLQTWRARLRHIKKPEIEAEVRWALAKRTADFPRYYQNSFLSPLSSALGSEDLIELFKVIGGMVQQEKDVLTAKKRAILIEIMKLATAKIHEDPLMISSIQSQLSADTISAFEKALLLLTGKIKNSWKIQTETWNDVAFIYEVSLTHIWPQPEQEQIAFLQHLVLWLVRRCRLMYCEDPYRTTKLLQQLCTYSLHNLGPANILHLPDDTNNRYGTKPVLDVILRTYLAVGDLASALPTLRMILENGYFPSKFTASFLATVLNGKTSEAQNLLAGLHAMSQSLHAERSKSTDWVQGMIFHTLEAARGKHSTQSGLYRHLDIEYLQEEARILTSEQLLMQVRSQQTTARKLQAKRKAGKTAKIPSENIKGEDVPERMGDDPLYASWKRHPILDASMKAKALQPSQAIAALDILRSRVMLQARISPDTLRHLTEMMDPIKYTTVPFPSLRMSVKRLFPTVASGAVSLKSQLKIKPATEQVLIQAANGCVNEATDLPDTGVKDTTLEGFFFLAVQTNDFELAKAIYRILQQKVGIHTIWRPERCEVFEKFFISIAQESLQMARLDSHSWDFPAHLQNSFEFALSIYFDFKTGVGNMDNISPVISTTLLGIIARQQDDLLFKHSLYEVVEDPQFPLSSVVFSTFFRHIEDQLANNHASMWKISYAFDVLQASSRTLSVLDRQLYDSFLEVYARHAAPIDATQAQAIVHSMRKSGVKLRMHTYHLLIEIQIRTKAPDMIGNIEALLQEMKISGEQPNSEIGDLVRLAYIMGNELDKAIGTYIGGRRLSIKHLDSLLRKLVDCGRTSDAQALCQSLIDSLTEASAQPDSSSLRDQCLVLIKSLGLDISIPSEQGNPPPNSKGSLDNHTGRIRLMIPEEGIVPERVSSSSAAESPGHFLLTTTPTSPYASQLYASKSFLGDFFTTNKVDTQVAMPTPAVEQEQQWPVKRHAHIQPNSGSTNFRNEVCEVNNSSTSVYHFPSHQSFDDGSYAVAMSAPPPTSAMQPRSISFSSSKARPSNQTSLNFPPFPPGVFRSFSQEISKMTFEQIQALRLQVERQAIARQTAQQERVRMERMRAGAMVGRWDGYTEFAGTPWY